MSETMPEHERPPLAGITVLDMSRILAGPLAAMTLGDLGADVIKIENPAGGDDTRGWGPPFADGEAGYYLAFNRNKRSIAVDLKHPDGAAVIRELAQCADVLIENYRIGTLDRLGLGPDTLMEANPRLIYASVSGYGRTGPRAREPGYDFVIQAESGLMSITGDKSGEPQKVGLPICDIITGLTLGQTILAALHARNRDGCGQYIDMSLLEAQMAVMGNVGTGALITAREAERYGNAHPNIVPYQVFQAADSPFVVACGNERQYAAFCNEVLERPELLSDERFSTNRHRVENRSDFEAIIEPILAESPAACWIAKLKRHGIPAGRVRGVYEALTSPEAVERGMVVSPREGSERELKLVRSAHRLSRTPPQESFSPPPRLGADAEAILAGRLGMTPAQIESLRAAGVVGGCTG